MPLTDELIREAGERYFREQDRYAKLAELVADVCRRDVVEKHVIRATVQWRAKDRKRFEKKLQKWLADTAKTSRVERISNVDDVFREAGGDLAGVRVATYVETDRLKVVEAIKKIFAGPGSDHVDVDNKDEAARERGSFYRATHCQVSLRQDVLVGTYENLHGLSCEIQVCSLLAHAWNEIEHDLGYKPLSGKLSALEGQLLEVLGRQTEAGDIVISALLSEKEKRLLANQGKFADEYDFVVRMRGSFLDSPDFGSNAGQLYEELVALEMDTPQKINEQLLTEDYLDRAQGLLDRLADFSAEEGRYRGLG